MTEPAETIAEGVAAWGRIKDHGRKSWSDWIAVGHALQLGRTSAMRTAERNDAVGTRYNRAMVAWLRGNGLEGINAQERYRMLLCLENIREIEHWREGLPEEQRRRLNHPNAIWAHWRRTTMQPGEHPVTTTTNPKHTSFSQEHVRRAGNAIGQAVRDDDCRDIYKLARIALQAALPFVDDVRALLNPPAVVARPAKARTVRQPPRRRAIDAEQPTA